MGKAWCEVEVLAQLQPFPSDWLFRRVVRRAAGMASSKRFELLTERVALGLLAFGRLEDGEVRGVLRDAEREIA